MTSTEIEKLIEAVDGKLFGEPLSKTPVIPYSTTEKEKYRATLEVAYQLSLLNENFSEMMGNLFNNRNPQIRVMVEAGRMADSDTGAEAMNTKEILERQKCIEGAVGSITPGGSGEVAGICYWLSEIALQFAQANENLAKIANPLMVANMELTDVEVFESVKSFHATYPESPLKGDPRYQDRINEACKKLGIPMEGK